MVIFACSKEVTWSSIDITNGLFNANTWWWHCVGQTPTNPYQNGHCEPKHCVACEESNTWFSRNSAIKHQKFRDLWTWLSRQVCSSIFFKATPTQTYGSLQKKPKKSIPKIPPCNHCMRNDEWTTQLHDHHVLSYVDVYVNDLLIACPRSLHDW